MTEDDLWGPIDMARWTRTPCVSGRLATEKDVKEGRAAFCIEGGVDASPATDVELPALGIQVDEDSGEELPVVVIQAEIVDGECLFGVRYVDGGNGVCTPEEIRLQPTRPSNGA
jgi:hypothetical protein